MAQIINIEDLQDTPGAARVSFDDSSSMVVPKSVLPPQLQLQSSGATAQLMSEDPGMSRSDAAPPGPAMSSAPSPAPAPVSVGPSSEGEFLSKYGAPTPAPQPMQPMQAPEPQQQPQMEILSSTERAARALESPYRYVPGSPAFDPKKEAAKRSAVPVSQTEARTGMRDYDPQAVSYYQTLESMAASTKAEADKLQADNQLKQQQMLADQQNRFIQQQVVEQKAQEDAYNSKMQGLEQEAKAVAQREINPDRVFQNQSVFQTLGFAVAAGLTARANPGGPNQVLSMIEKRVDTDIRAQEHDILNSKSAVDNALSRQQAQWGSIQNAKSALKVQQYEALKQKIMASSAEVGTKVASLNADAMLTALSAKQAQEAEKLRVESKGVGSVSTASAMMSPRAATSGGLRPKTADQYSKDVGKAAELRDKSATTEGKQLGNLEKRAELTGAIPGKASAEITKYGEDRLKTEGAKELVQRFMAANGIKKGEDGTWQSSKSQMAGIGPSNLWEPDSWQTAEGKKNNADLNQLKAAIAFVMYGASTPEQLETVDKIFLSRTNEESLSAGLGATLEAANSKLRTLDAAYGSKVVSEFERRRATQGKEKKAKQAGISEPE